MNKEKNHSIYRKPDLSSRPLNLTTERLIDLPPKLLYQAWTQKLDKWFAAPGSVLMEAKVNTPFFFETVFEGARHPHYGRFLRLVPNRLVELTWVNGPDGTRGNETVVKVELIPRQKGTLLKLTHAGFPDEASLNRHKDAWPLVLEQLEQKLKEHINKT